MELLFLQLVYLEKTKGLEYIKKNKEKFTPLYAYFQNNPKALKKLDLMLS